jgi:hypothetical protein
MRVRGILHLCRTELLPVILNEAAWQEIRKRIEEVA